MKFIVLVTLIVIMFLFTNSLVSKPIKKLLRKFRLSISDEIEFKKKFIKEAEGHISAVNGEDYVKKTFKPIAERAFNVAKNIKRALKSDVVPIYGVFLTKKEGEATTFLMNSLGMNNSNVNKFSSLWRICVPTNTRKKPFADVTCAVTMCLETLEETLKQPCVEGELISPEKVKVGSSKLKFRG